MSLDIAPFAYREESDDGRTLTFRWEEVRDIHRIELRLAGDVPPTARGTRGKVNVHYWRKFWPQRRALPVDLSLGTLGRAGWKPRDDWFNGEWQLARVMARRRGNLLIITFVPLTREFADVPDFDVQFRQTMQLRLALPEGVRAEDVAIFTDTPIYPRAITVEMGCGQPAHESDPQVEVYNGTLESMRGSTVEDPRLQLAVGSTWPDPLSYDHAVVTLRTSAFAVSFRPRDLDNGKPIWIPDLGVLVSDSSANVRYSPELAASLRVGVSRYDAIAAEPEQSFPRAMREQPPKEPMHMVLGVEGGRQKFAVGANGDLFTHIRYYVRQAPAGDTPRLGWQGDCFALRFGWDNWLASARRIVNGYLPILEARKSRGALDVEQEVLVTPLGQSILAGPAEPDAPVVCMVRLTFINNGETPLAHVQPLQFMAYDAMHVERLSRNLRQPTRREKMRLDGDVAWALGSPDCVRAACDANGRGEFAAAEDGLIYRVELAPGQRHSIVLKVPMLGLLRADEIARLRAKDFDTERAEAARYWEQRVAGAATISTPDPDITDFYHALLTHILINDEFEPGSQRWMGRVSSFSYGSYANETIMQVLELDRRGLHDEARRHLAAFLHYQGTAPLPGNFKSTDGLFYGSGGYECGGYNQHHGWVLWGLAEHYSFTGDRAWLLEIAPKLVAGCDWVTREREATKRTDAAGRKALEYGFLPAGSLEDVMEFCYWLSTNALTCRGLEAAAQALAEAGHPQGPRLVRDAADYRADLLAGFRESMARSPVVRLRDGTYVPHHPSRLYWRGRDFGWIREVLEGSINLVTTVLDPCSREATWVLQDYEDNRYLDAPFNYPLGQFDNEWFSRGGFSFQPNLVYFKPHYLWRDQIEHFLRAFFNALAACFRPDIRAATEHPLPTLAEWSGDHFKSSDESMAAMWLRMMFIQEDGDTLYLGRGLPRAWLGADEGVAIRNAATYFGPMSMEMRPRDGGRRIVARIDPPTARPPREVVVRFRHPAKARLQQVTVDGSPVTSFDPDQEWVRLGQLTAPVMVEARFAEAAV